MKRDFELIRLLLMELEGEEQVNLSSFTPEQVNYQVPSLKVHTERIAMITEAASLGYFPNRIISSRS
jgi:hypothetical protein